MLIIREEEPEDATAISRLVAEAFAPMPFSDGSEAQLVEALRRDGDLLLSLVAEQAGAVIGHIGFSPITVGGKDAGWVQMAPVSVTPPLQRCGVGSALIHAGIAEMRARGAKGVGVEGDPNYYERFGFAKTDAMFIPGPHAIYYRALLIDGEMPEGEVHYAPAFY
jgi:putative acetyltransferase